MKQDLIKVVVKEPYKAPEVRIIKNDLKTFQGLVGGWIEIVFNVDMPETNVSIILNEEGKLIGLPANFPYGGVDFIMGTAVFINGDVDEDGETLPLSDEQAEAVMKAYPARSPIEVLDQVRTVLREVWKDED